MKRIVVLILIAFLFLGVGCSRKTSNNNNGKQPNDDSLIKGDAQSILAKAAQNLRQSTDFEATKTVTVKINGKETSVTLFNFITNSSSIYSASKTELKNGNERIVFKRVHLKNVQYEFIPAENKWLTVDKGKNNFSFSYSYYKLNRSFTLDTLNNIYSPDKNVLGDFVKNLTKTDTEKVGGITATVLSYSYQSSDSKSSIERQGKIYITEMDGKLYPIRVEDDKLVTFKSNSTTVENVTNIMIKNIGNAKGITTKK